MSTQEKMFTEAHLIKADDTVFMVPDSQELAYTDDHGGFDPENAEPCRVLSDAEPVDDPVEGPPDGGDGVEILVDFRGQERHFVPPADLRVPYIPYIPQTSV